MCVNIESNKVTSWGATSCPQTHTQNHGEGSAVVFVYLRFINSQQGEQHGSMYKSKAWKKKREAILRRDGYRSQLAARYGRSIQGDTVHHMLPVEFFPEYRFADWNLITITHDEHNKLHDRETHRLTAEGLALARRAALRAGLDIEEVMKRLEGSHEEDQDGNNERTRSNKSRRRRNL